jgi:hypothetical protein
MRKIWLFMLVAMMALAVGTPARADVTCASICTVTLTQTNVIQLAGVQVNVTINNTGTHTVLTFQMVNNPITNTPIGMDQIGWTGGHLSHGSNTFSSSYNATASSHWGGNLVTGPVTGAMDGFGKFNVQGADPASTAGISPSTAITMTLAGKVTTFYSNSSGNVFTVHVRFGGNCSGFIGGLAGTGSANNDANCTRPGSVPEPGSMVLFGSGLLGLAGALKRRYLA